MKRVCRRIQSTLADRGAAALRADEGAQRHLDECDDCFAVLESLTELDAAFEAMPPVDAPDELVERLLAHEEVRSPATTTTGRGTPWRERFDRAGRILFARGRPRLQASLALLLLAAISLPLYFTLQRQGEVDQVAQATDTPEGFVVQSYRFKTPEPQNQPAGAREQPDFEVVAESERQLDDTATLDEAMPDSSTVGGFLGDYRRMGEDAKAPAVADSPVWVGTEADITFRGGSPRIESDATGPFDKDDDARQRVRDRLRERLRSLPRGLQDAEPEADPVVAEKKKAEASDEDLDLPLREPAPAADEPARGDTAYLVDGVEVRSAAGPRELAQAFLAERERFDSVSFKPSTGYWTNTYVPGDPALRFLQARLARHDRSAFESIAGRPLLLHDAARRTTQPFDPPSDAALSVQLHADRNALDGESRMLVQVGLVATDRHGGRRPAMNVGVVLDLRGEVAPEDAAGLRALLLAFGEARDLGDRFRLIVAGRPGGEVVAPEDFRHGPLTVVSRSLFASTPEEEGLGLADAVRAAIERVGGADDPNLPLGSSAVVVITSQPLGDDASVLAELAHRSAVAGLPVSVVGVGDGVDLTELEHLALAGQGSRRLLREPPEATALVDRELSAVGRVVARAVRLRIGLQPGVRLIDVVGARRYSQADAIRVRQAERSIDLRVARNLGIEADRGDDEPGIQIVIPTFYTGDRHVILLDVVAPGPGPIADVTVRFKDLVELGNGVASARLDLPRGDGRRGPLERNVLKNLLAQRLREVLKRAAAEVATGEPASASEGLVQHRALLAGLALELPGFEHDRDLEGDVAMLDEYAQLLGSGVVEQQEQRLHLARSLSYAGRLKVLPAPVSMGGAR